MNKLDGLPQSLKVWVECYDAKHRELLKAPPYPAHAVQAMDGRLIEIPTSDFLQAYLVHKKGIRPDIPWSLGDFATLSKAWQEMEDTITLENGTIEWHPKAEKQTVTEHVGEALGICVINQLHELTDADWTPIRILGRQKGKVLDFREASDGQHLILLETKGLAPRIAQAGAGFGGAQSRDIQEKKDATIAAPDQDGYQHGRDVLYGTISAYYPETGFPARVWLLDPPLPEESTPAEHPLKWRLLSRLNYVADILAIISPHSNVSVALRNRLNTWAFVENWKCLLSQPLLTGTAEDIELSDRFWRVRSHILDWKTPGTVIGAEDGVLLFIGLHLPVLLKAVSPSLDSISEPGNRPSNGKVRGSFLLTRDMAAEIEADGIEERGRVRINVEGIAYFTSGGLCFGWFTPLS